MDKYREDMRDLSVAVLRAEKDEDFILFQGKGQFLKMGVIWPTG